MSKNKVAVIIPAYNEERGIAGVIKSVLGAKIPDEVLVISDGSTDKTVEIAKSFDGVRVIDQMPNQGKASVMVRGVTETSAGIILFLDSDLVGLESEFVDALISPVLDNTADMTLGLFSGGRFSTDWIQKVFPFLTGQRAMKRSIWEGAKIGKDEGYAVEMLLTKYIAAHNLRVKNILLEGCTQYLKEEKTKGKVVDGFARRMKMAWEISKQMLTPAPPEYREAKKRNKKK